MLDEIENFNHFFRLLVHPIVFVEKLVERFSEVVYHLLSYSFRRSIEVISDE